jgi:hypothetical protein
LHHLTPALINIKMGAGGITLCIFLEYMFSRCKIKGNNSSQVSACFVRAIHTSIHTYIHTYLHTYTHTRIHAYIHAYMHACMRACVLACLSTRSRASQCAHAQMSKSWHIDAQVRTRMCNKYVRTVRKKLQTIFDAHRGSRGFRNSLASPWLLPPPGVAWWPS